MSVNPYRLPRHVVPTHYRIRLEPDVETFDFQGSVDISIEVLEPTSSIVLNAAEIDIKRALLISGEEDVSVGDIYYDTEYERATLHLDHELAPGTYRLSIEHTGTINDQLRGLYRSLYRDADGNEHPIATSQCQSTDARRIFPCWDEPDFKATFQTTMVVADGLEAYSNAGELDRVRLDDGRAEFRFAKTMRMSPYLLAFIAGPFEATEPVEVRGTPIRIIVPRGLLGLSDVAMENAVFCFEYLSDYYGIPYPGDKLDHIALPDFPAGAMENVGLITYRDAYLVIDREKAAQSELQNSVDVIGHEIAHQWFGNLVTMKWWEGAWLNESFASFMEMKATHAMHPEWKRWLAFRNIEVPWAMATDQLATTRTIEFEVNSPTEVDEMFDAITYGKGSAVLRMIEQFIGEEEFRIGVGHYLRNHEYSNTETTDLWEGLDSASDWPVGSIMNTWVYQRGFPQIDVANEDEGLRVSQRRFLVNPDDTDTTIWKVPLQLRGAATGRPFMLKILLEEDETVVPIDGDVEWLVANAGGHGFYRTAYSDELFSALLDNLGALDDIERYTVVEDTLAFVRSGRMPASRFLDLVANFGDETEQAIWSVITGGLGLLEHHCLEESVRADFQEFVTRLVTPALGQLGWEVRAGDADLERKLRGELIACLGNLGEDADTIARSRETVAQLLEGGPVDPEVATAALSVYARHGGAGEYETLWSTYKASATPLDQVRYLRSVAAIPVDELAVSTLDKIVGGDIRTQDAFWVFARLLVGKAGPAAWRRARMRWDGVVAAMPGMTRRRIVEGLPALSQPEVATDVKAFFAEHPIPEATQALAQKLELLDANVKLRERETPRLTIYLSGS